MLDCLTDRVTGARLSVWDTVGAFVIKFSDIKAGRQLIEGIADTMLRNNEIEHRSRHMKGAPGIALAYRSRQYQRSSCASYKQVMIGIYVHIPTMILIPCGQAEEVIHLVQRRQTVLPHVFPHLCHCNWVRLRSLDIHDFHRLDHLRDKALIWNTHSDDYCGSSAASNQN